MPKPRARRTTAKVVASATDAAVDAKPKRPAPARRATAEPPDDAAEAKPVDGGIESAA
jgi:hypothetical protein